MLHYLSIEIRQLHGIFCAWPYNLLDCVFLCLLHSVKNSSYSLPSYHPYSNSYDYSDQSRQSERSGLCGLSNLGNTCFMNSAVQVTSTSSGRYWEIILMLSKPSKKGLFGKLGTVCGSAAELCLTALWANRPKFNCVHAAWCAPRETILPRSSCNT